MRVEDVRLLEGLTPKEDKKWSDLAMKTLRW